MRKKLLIFMLLFMLFSISFVSARMCDTENVLDVLRKALYVYYTNPEESSFTADELKDLLSFYVGIQTGQVTIDCTEQENNIDRANALQDQIPSCSDGTKYGKCSSNKPMYCYAGRLVPRCRLCGCPSDQWCDITYVYTEKGNKGQWGKCYPGKNITCTVNTDCGTSTYIGDYYCSTGQESTLHIGDVYRKYQKYECVDPGKNNATCFNWTDSILIDDCNETEQCIEGEAECQTVNVTNVTCTDSDGGINYFVKGTTTSTAVWDIINGSGTYMDTCQSPNYIDEYYCYNNPLMNNRVEIRHNIVPCPTNYCQDGICVNATNMTECVTPTSGMSITNDTTLCTGEYQFSEKIRIIKINANNVVLDCNGAHLIGVSGPSSQGLYSEDAAIYTSYSGITVKNCIASYFTRGIWFNGNYNTAENSTTKFNGEGFSLAGDYNSLTKCKTENNYVGVILWEAHNDSVWNNEFRYNHFGLVIDRGGKTSSDNKIWANDFYQEGIHMGPGPKGGGYAWNNSIYCVDGVGNNYYDGATGPECQPAVWKKCSDCGTGFFNTCDKDECSAISEFCYFVPSLIGGSCQTFLDNKILYDNCNDGIVALNKWGGNNLVEAEGWLKSSGDWNVKTFNHFWKDKTVILKVKYKGSDKQRIKLDGGPTGYIWGSADTGGNWIDEYIKLDWDWDAYSPGDGIVHSWWSSDGTHWNLNRLGYHQSYRGNDEGFHYSPNGEGNEMWIDWVVYGCSVSTDCGTCSDETPYALCSIPKPKYCNYGTLVDNCEFCGCDTGVCQPGGNCESNLVTVPGVINGDILTYSGIEDVTQTVEVNTSWYVSSHSGVYGDYHVWDYTNSKWVWIKNMPNLGGSPGGPFYTNDSFLFTIKPEYVQDCTLKIKLQTACPGSYCWGLVISSTDLSGLSC